jgi:hypothetical protein
MKLTQECLRPGQNSLVRVGHAIGMLLTWMNSIAILPEMATPTRSTWSSRPTLGTLGALWVLDSPMGHV